MRKFLFTCLVVLLVISFMPMPAKSCSNALKAGSLIKASNDSVYYYGADSKRYVFPNQKTYNTWFISFDLVLSISNEALGEIPIGGNVTYKPGKKLVKIQTDPKVYWVDKEGTLRHLASEEIAKQLFGYNWHILVDDVPDAFFVNYKIGLPIKTAVLPTIEPTYSINQDKSLSNQPDPDYNQLGTIELNGAAIDNTTAKLSWTVKNFTSEKGFKVVMSNQPDPVYPGNDFHYLSDPNARSDKWYDLFQSGTYYFRVCEYLGGSCGIYSNNVAIKLGGTTTDNSNSSISLSGSWNSEKNKVILEWKPINLYASQGFKVVKSTEPNPVYPGNDYHYLTDPNARADKWVGLAAGTYHFRVCEYLGGACGVYSNDITVTVSGSGTVTDNSNGKITLFGYYDETYNKVVLTWQSNYSIYNGVKIVKSTEPNPVYPGNDYHYLSGEYLLTEFSQDPPGGTDIWKNLSPGIYHFRACEYLGGACGIYSNDISVTVPGQTYDNSNGTITLSGYYEPSLGKVILNWTVGSMYSTQGFKVVTSTQAYPVYPGNEYHYLSSPDARSDKWIGLSSGTYHFRVCEYLGGKCGIYSNDLAITVQ